VLTYVFKSLCMGACVCECAYVCVCASLCVYLFVYLCVSVRCEKICLYVYFRVRVHNVLWLAAMGRFHACAHLCVCVCVCVCVRACMCESLCVHTSVLEIFFLDGFLIYTIFSVSIIAWLSNLYRKFYIPV